MAGARLRAQGDLHAVAWLPEFFVFVQGFRILGFGVLGFTV